MFCSSCGSELVEGAAFCSSCGASVAVVNDASKEVPLESNPEPQSAPQTDWKAFLESIPSDRYSLCREENGDYVLIWRTPCLRELKRLGVAERFELVKNTYVIYEDGGTRGPFFLVEERSIQTSLLLEDGPKDLLAHLYFDLCSLKDSRKEGEWKGWTHDVNGSGYPGLSFAFGREENEFGLGSDYLRISLDTDLPKYVIIAATVIKGDYSNANSYLRVLRTDPIEQPKSQQGGMLSSLGKSESSFGRLMASRASAKAERREERRASRMSGYALDMKELIFDAFTFSPAQGPCLREADYLTGDLPQGWS